jgi:tetratricopeptide (TPR) repeat protein
MCAMTDDLYERYKEALRTGHVAMLRGALDEAVRAYRVAADIAPSRALPHTSLGGVYMRLEHLEDALTEFAAAVARSPHDEGALLGQAEALSAAGLRSDAAVALDHVAEIQEAAGRLPEAAGTLRRAVELDEAPGRIRRQRALLREIRFSTGDHAAEQLLGRALRLRDEPGGDAIRPAAGMAFVASQAASMRPAAPPVPERVWPTVEHALVEAPEPVVVEATELAAEPEPEPVAAEAVEIAAVAEPERVDVVAIEPEPAPEPELLRAAEPEPVLVAAAAERSAVGVMEGIDGLSIAMPGAIGESEHQPTGDELLVAAEAADLAGDSTALRSLLLWTARAYAREGRFEAGLDATHRLLQSAPSDVDAHLVLVELYVARSWDGLAAEKLRLLGRLAELNNDEETRQRLCAAATRAFPQDPTLEYLCA